VLLVQIPTLAALVHLRPLHLEDWAIAVSAGVFTGGASLLLVLRRKATPIATPVRGPGHGTA
jgi:hypothetical protein